MSEYKEAISVIDSILARDYIAEDLPKYTALKSAIKALKIAHMVKSGKPSDEVINKMWWGHEGTCPLMPKDVESIFKAMSKQLIKEVEDE